MARPAASDGVLRPNTPEETEDEIVTRTWLLHPPPAYLISSPGPFAGGKTKERQSRAPGHGKEEGVCVWGGVVSSPRVTLWGKEGG